MEDILASIRRILSEDEVTAPGAAAPRSPTAQPEERVVPVMECWSWIPR